MWQTNREKDRQKFIMCDADSWSDSCMMRMIKHYTTVTGHWQSVEYDTVRYNLSRAINPASCKWFHDLGCVINRRRTHPCKEFVYLSCCFSLRTQYTENDLSVYYTMILVGGTMNSGCIRWVISSSTAVTSVMCLMIVVSMLTPSKGKFIDIHKNNHLCYLLWYFWPTICYKLINVFIFLIKTKFSFISVWHLFSSSYHT